MRSGRAGCTAVLEPSRRRIHRRRRAAIRAALAGTAGGAEVLRDELIGPSLGEELRRGALIALAVALAAQLVYLAVRFRWTFSAGAVAALAANVTVVVGVFAWLGKPLDGVFLTALLTVIGYTVNDSVMVFDRIREVGNVLVYMDDNHLTASYAATMALAVARHVEQALGW